MGNINGFFNFPNMGNDFRFLYWDDYEDYTDEEELAAERRMRAILQNGNNGEHYEQDT